MSVPSPASTKRIEEFLDEQLNLDEYGETWRLFQEFMGTEIRPGEKYQDFTARFDSAYKVLVRRDEEWKISNRLLAMFIRFMAKLKPAALMTVRGNVRWKKVDGTANQDVYTETITAMNEICAGEHYKSTGSEQIKLTTAMGEVNMVQYRGECLYVNREPVITQSQHDVLMAEQKKKNKPGGKKTRTDKKVGFNESGEEETVKTRLSKVRCFECQQYGHYRSNCPDQDSQDNHFVEEETYIISEAFAGFPSFPFFLLSCPGPTSGFPHQ